MKKLAQRGDPGLESELERKAQHVLENGPRLTYHSTIHLVAKCQTGRHELHGGLGAMGVGEMWSLADPKNKEDAEAWAALPVQYCSGYGVDTCPRPPMTPKELAGYMCHQHDSMTRNGGNVPRWLMLVENAEGVIEPWGHSDHVPYDERARWFAELAAKYPVKT